MSKIDQTLKFGSVEIEGYRQVSDIMLERISDPSLFVRSGSDAYNLRKKLKNTIIDDDLQSLCENSDGSCLLTSVLSKDDVLSTLKVAGISVELLNIAKAWKADFIAIHFFERN